MIPRYSNPEMAELWSDESKFNNWVKVEIAVVEVLEELERVPAGVTARLKEHPSVKAERVLEIEEETRHDVLAFLSAWNELIGEDSQYVHRGMTSNDLLDCSLALTLKDATGLLENEIEATLASLKALALKYKETPCIARSHGIHAQPTSFGLKVAGFYAELQRASSRFQRASEEAICGKLSGAVGTYSELPPEIEERVCEKLGIQSELVATQVVSRDRVASLVQAMALVASCIERACIEVRHLQRTEVAEVAEPFGKGQKGSSAMPHKKNPILTENMTGLCRLIRSHVAAVQENILLWHERDISHSSVERVILPDCTIALHFLLGRFRKVIDGLQVDDSRMMKNLESTRGLISSGALLVALCDKGMERDAAYALVQSHALRCWEGGANLLERVSGDPEVSSRLSGEELEELFSVQRHLKHVDAVFNRTFGEK